MIQTYRYNDVARFNRITVPYNRLDFTQEYDPIEYEDGGQFYAHRQDTEDVAAQNRIAQLQQKRTLMLEQRRQQHEQDQINYVQQHQQQQQAPNDDAIINRD